jgi:hypothetical protein
LLYLIGAAVGRRLNDPADLGHIHDNEFHRNILSVLKTQA